MSCTRYAADLADAVAGEAVAAGLQAHLRACVACRGRLNEGRGVLAAFDRDLGEALGIEPSPALLLRMKEGIEQGGETRVGIASFGRSVAWRIAATVVMAAGVAGSVWLLRPSAPDRNPPSRAANASPVLRVGAGNTSAGAGAATAPPVVPGTASAGSGTVRSTRRAAPSEPEVIVPPGEAVLLARFVTILRTRVVEPTSLLVARADGDLAEPKPIDVSPLEIRPLTDELEQANDQGME